VDQNNDQGFRRDCTDAVISGWCGSELRFNAFRTHCGRGGWHRAVLLSGHPMPQFIFFGFEVPRFLLPLVKSHILAGVPDINGRSTEWPLLVSI